MWNRYSAIAAIVLGLITITFGAYERRYFDNALRQQLRELKELNQLPVELRDVDVETFNLENCDMEVSDSILLHLGLADFVQYCWYLWVPAITICCLIVGWLAHVLLAKAS